MSQIVWKPVPIKGFENFYEVNNIGQVRSLDRVIPCNTGRGSTFIKGRVLNQANSRGYRKVTLSTGGIKHQSPVHILIALAFIGEPPGTIGTRKNQWQINHLDGNKSNNCVDNLEWVVPSKNLEHARQTGLSSIGERHTSAKLTEEDILKIVELHQKGLSCAEIGRLYHVTSSNIEVILKGKSWKHLELNVKYSKFAPSGKGKGNSKLRIEDVKRIKELYEAGLTKTQIAKQFNIYKGTVGRIVEGKIWKNVD